LQKYYDRKSNTETSRGGVHNNGYDDAHYDYLVNSEEVFADHYVLKHRLGKVGYLFLTCIMSGT
jgi:hypothetical protein